MDRRRFLASMAAGVFTPLQLRAATLKFEDKIPLEKTLISLPQWQTIALVQDHLFPTEENAPGAKEIRATRYMQAAMADPELDPEDREFIRNGLMDLEALVSKNYPQPFAKLDENQREAVLREFEKKGAGRAWIQEVLHYIFEALLTDPIYGGNPDAVGWQWLNVTPGFPRPTKNKRYFLL